MTEELLAHKLCRETYKSTVEKANEHGDTLNPVVHYFLGDDEVSDLVIMMPDVNESQAQKVMGYTTAFMPIALFDFKYMSMFSDVFVKAEPKDKYENIDDVKAPKGSLRNDPTAVEAIMGFTRNEKGLLYQTLDEYGRKDNGDLYFKKPDVEPTEVDNDMLTGGLIQDLLEATYLGKKKFLKELDKEKYFVKFTQQLFDRMTDAGFQIGFSERFMKILLDMGIINDEGQCTHECDCEND